MATTPGVSLDDFNNRELINPKAIEEACKGDSIDSLKAFADSIDLCQELIKNGITSNEGYEAFQKAQTSLLKEQNAQSTDIDKSSDYNNMKLERIQPANENEDPSLKAVWEKIQNCQTISKNIEQLTEEDLEKILKIPEQAYQFTTLLQGGIESKEKSVNDLNNIILATENAMQKNTKMAIGSAFMATALGATATVPLIMSAVAGNVQLNPEIAIIGAAAAIFAIACIYSIAKKKDQGKQLTILKNGKASADLDLSLSKDYQKNIETEKTLSEVVEIIESKVINPALEQKNEQGQIESINLKKKLAGQILKTGDKITKDAALRSVASAVHSNIIARIEKEFAQTISNKLNM